MRMTMRKNSLLQRFFPKKDEIDFEADTDPTNGVKRALSHAAMQGQMAKDAESTAINFAVEAMEAAIVALDEMADICREGIELSHTSMKNEDEALELMMGARYAALVSRYDRISGAANVSGINLITGEGAEIQVPLAGPGGIDYAVAPQTLAPWDHVGLPHALPSRLDGQNMRSAPLNMLTNHLDILTEASDKLCADAQMLAWRLKTLA